MHLKNSVFFFALFTASLVPKTFTHRCYNCTGCNDPFNSSAVDVTTINCDGSCVKKKVNNVVDRTCLTQLEISYCEEGEGEDDWLCHCTTDLCNRSQKPYSTSVLVISVVMATITNVYDICAYRLRFYKSEI